jgi:predicted house-cleaning noncanonical NTP pyrophosphatase (MazG superfamily)
MSPPKGKLVRDRIPDIIRGDGGTPNVRYVVGAELRDALFTKLAEETAELRDAPDELRPIEELADVLECVRGLASHMGVAMERVEKVAAVKREERGGFDEGVWLVM